jgi:hypothetical protein
MPMSVMVEHFNRVSFYFFLERSHHSRKAFSLWVL